MKEYCLTCGETDCHCGDFVSSLPPTAEQVAAADAYDAKMGGNALSIFE